MPNKDKTGPMGKGPGTGRGMGNCSPEDLKKYKDMGYISKNDKSVGRGQGGQGKGLGRGYGRGRSSGQ